MPDYNPAEDINLSVIGHPVIQELLSRLREAATATEQFRTYADRISMLLAAEATRDLSVSPKVVTTPMGEGIGAVLGERVILVPVLRAGLALEAGFRQVLPQAISYHVGMVRDERTAVASNYLNKLDGYKPRPTDRLFVLDPMLATGGSLADGLHLIENVIHPAGMSIDDVTVICIVTAQEGLARVRTQYPNVRIFTPAVDPTLNEHKFIVPGLGDFGDRYFGTATG